MCRALGPLGPLACGLRGLRLGRQAFRARSALVPIGAGLYGPAGLQATVYAKGPPTVASLAFDSQGRLWLAAAGLEAHARGDGVYMIARPGGPAVKVVSGLEDPLGLAWFEGRLYVASTGRVDSFGAFNGRRFTEHTRIIDGPVAGGENNLLLMTPTGRFLMGVTATCDHCTPSSGWSGSIVLLPSRRQRSAPLRHAHPRAFRACLLPRYERSVRDHEPA